MLLQQAVDEYLFDCECRKLSPKTIENYSKQIRYLQEYLVKKGIKNLEEVIPAQIKQFLAIKQREGCKANYINNLLKAFKCLFKYCFEEGYTDTCITAKVKNQKKTKVIINTFTAKNVKDMINFYDGKKYLDVRNKMILIFLFDTGIRLNELVHLKPEDVMEDCIIIKYGKNYKERVVPKTPYLTKHYFKYLRIRESYFSNKSLLNKELFLSKNCKMLTHEMVERIVKIAGEGVNVSKDIRCSPHTCRHTYAQMQLMNGLDIYSLSRILGHENISITQIYLNSIRDKEIVTAGVKTSPLMNL
ncbi:MAG: tyrosine-type recombinase/integrase [Clostridia bacterium]|nr:tyrosine-type recombinase/integrase [Clostridia bacterium]MCI2001060.1 tyrosine-type recombinase/integrase [Clostridia bacterium]MCI2015659.1 tyrosine-type recombinase/integrase [Clostridia bacterium]